MRQQPKLGLPERPKKKGPFPQKALTLHGDPWWAHRAKDCALANTKREQAVCHLGPSLPGDREAGVRQPEPEVKGLLQT